MASIKSDVDYKQHKIGYQAEDQACLFLQKKGLTLLARNYKSYMGEIDLIMKDKNYLVFIEVRYRKKSGYGSGIESITWQKQHKIIKTAQYYLLQHRITEKTRCRFDVVGITQEDQGTTTIEWIKDAFQDGE